MGKVLQDSSSCMCMVVKRNSSGSNGDGGSE
jgi:hypothetical protein